MRVRVKKNKGPAFIGGLRYREGEIVDLPDAKTCPMWGEKVDGKATSEARPAHKDKPVTLRDMAKSGEKVGFVGEKKTDNK